jgi:hypothetical protein
MADDIKTFSVNKIKLMESTSAVVNWSISNALPLAKDKTIFIKIRRRRKQPSNDTLRIEGTDVQATTHVRDLGITVNDDLEPAMHIKEVITKAFRMSNLILRIFKSNRIDTYKRAFYTLVLPILEYASVVWNPLYVKDVNSLESVQRRFTKRAQRQCGIEVESYSSRLRRWRLDTLELRRLKIDLSWVFKIVYGYVDLDREMFFRINQTEEEIKIYPLPVKSDCRNNTQCNNIAYRTYKVWNQMPLSVRNSPTVAAFKRNLKKHDLKDSFVGNIDM